MQCESQSQPPEVRKHAGASQLTAHKVPWRGATCDRQLQLPGGQTSLLTLIWLLRFTTVCMATKGDQSRMLCTQCLCCALEDLPLFLAGCSLRPVGGHCGHALWTKHNLCLTRYERCHRYLGLIWDDYKPILQ